MAMHWSLLRAELPPQKLSINAKSVVTSTESDSQVTIIVGVTSDSFRIPWVTNVLDFLPWISESTFLVDKQHLRGYLKWI